MNRRIAIYVQHLLGAGHLIRAMSLAEGLVKRGHRVKVFSGGFPVERAVNGYTFVQLPAVRASDGNFTRLVDQHEHLIDDGWRGNRARILLDGVRDFRPDLVITETFPFGRRQFRFELEPLIQWVRSTPGVRLMASIRDVLQRRSESRSRETVEVIEHYYDAVLVHADPGLFRLDASFSLSSLIEHKLRYTGYIHQPPGVGCVPKNSSEELPGHDEIIVSGGSGTVSAGLINAAQNARSLSSARKRVWRLLSGRGAGKAVFSPEPGLIIEPNRADFFALLSHCALSVSQAGYNTTLDVLASGTRAVMVPFAGDGETEQSDRAQALHRAGRVIQLAETDLTPKRLAASIDQALQMPLTDLHIKLDGADTSARLIGEILQQGHV